MATELEGDDFSVGWAPRYSDPIYKRPSPGTTPTQPAGEDLDLRMGWDRFEKLVLELSRDLLDISHIMLRRYGTQGQTQDGIDIAGREPDGRYSVVQCKEYAKFTKSDLREAVETFANGKRPFGAYRFVVAVSTNAQTTQLAKELEKLQEEHPDLELDLWGSEQLNTALKKRADLVGQFWTRETADVVCTGAPPSGVPLSPPNRILQADQVLVGPLRTDEVAPRLRDAEAKRSEEPLEAAIIYGALADELNDSGYRGHASAMHDKQLDALAAAGAVDEAAALAGHLAAVKLHHGDDDSADLQRRWLDRWAGVDLVAQLTGTAPAAPASPETKRHAALISAAVRGYQDVLGDMDELLDVLNDTSSGVPAPPYQPLLVLLLAESMLIDAPERLSSLDNLVANAIGQVGATPIADVQNDVALRLRLIRAEYDDAEHERLLREARRHTLKRPHAALVHAREARRCALNAVPEDALDHWLDAVEDGIHADLTEDAANWLYAIQRLKSAYGIAMTVDEHRLAQSLRTSAGERLIPQYRNARELALNEFVANRPIAAVIATRRWLTESTVAGHWAAERSALELLGDLYGANAEPDRAASFYQRAGSTKNLSKLVRAVRDHALPLRPLSDAPWWELRGRFQVLAEQSDHLDDHSAETLLPELIALARQKRAEAPNHPLTIQVTASACALAARGSAAQAQEVLDLLENDVPRPPNEFRHSDREHSRACLAIVKTHPEVAQSAVNRLLDLAHGDAPGAIDALLNEQLLKMLGAELPDGSLAYSQSGTPSFAEEFRSAVRERVESLVTDRRHLSANLLQAVDPGNPMLQGAAEAARDRILNRPAPDPSNANSGVDIVASAQQASVLDVGQQKLCLDKMVAVAGDRGETAENRQEALIGASYHVRSQPAEVRSEVFARCSSFVRGDEDGSAFDAMITGPSHPLSVVQVNLGTSSLRGAGLRLAAASASTRDQCEWVRDNAFALLNSGEKSDVDRAVQVLHKLPVEVTEGIEPALLSPHKNVAVRQLAAVISVRRAEECEPTATALAHDPVVSVRWTLAHELSRAVGPPEVIDRLKDVLRTDSRYSVRRALTGT
ncbi:hypothetical protein O4328_28910 [Rhodococcus opacus]|uniref:Restriction endonuclease type IV Mrr domain-containing protein n=1 Tax=Rhodococcus opacus TaxID=37919 RepID=A0AAX3YP83_RHOOP|nr:HEAT repeat domain-containing protein [Rhodococcus opacus]MCZ4587662.1 hypothetical protein [Rhodococcus opacus]WLF51342.1 hypothetical protein Q5707_37350 [Rhodococcus opacus]